MLFGKVLQGLAIFLIPISVIIYVVIFHSATLVRTALVYPTFFIHDSTKPTSPKQRAESMAALDFGRLGYRWSSDFGKTLTYSELKNTPYFMNRSLTK